MQLVKVSRKYVQDIYSKVDKEVMINHPPKKGEKEKDRLNALLVRIKYRGKNREFAIPLSHAIKIKHNHKMTYFGLDNYDEKNQTIGGLYLKKCLPVNRSIYELAEIKKDPFLTVQKIIDDNESSIIKKFKTYLDEYISKEAKGWGFRYSTNIDAILNYMDKNY